jgi:broad specificity phosphatase PhoE
MSRPLPQIYLVRHGETPWTITRQHTGRKDLPLTENGERDAVQLGPHLRSLTVGAVYVSPLQRARRTCELAGFAHVAHVDPDLVEWDYGIYEGLIKSQIREQNPDWSLFRNGCPGGESPADVGARADHIIARVRALDGNALLFSSGHLLRVLAARWLGLEPDGGRLFTLDTTSLSILGYEHDLDEPIIRLWNDVRTGQS